MWFRQLGCPAPVPLAGPTHQEGGRQSSVAIGSSGPAGATGHWRCHLEQQHSPTRGSLRICMIQAGSGECSLGKRIRPAGAFEQAARPKHSLATTPSITRSIENLPAIPRPPPAPRRTRWTDPRAPQAAPGTRRDSLGAFLVAGALGEQDSPKTSQRLLKRAVSHFAYGESLAVRTRICCAVGGRPDSPKDLRAHSRNPAVDV
jgi:hypothetical protein